MLETDVLKNEGQRRLIGRLGKEKGRRLIDRAAQLGVTAPTVWAWKVGKYLPDARGVVACKQKLGIPPEAWLQQPKNGKP